VIGGTATQRVKEALRLAEERVAALRPRIGAMEDSEAEVAHAGA
jgi:hypothetical protein